MRAIRVETLVDEATASAIPALRPLLGRRVELIALEAEVRPANAPRPKLTLDELLAHRLEAPPGSAPLTNADIERAILEGALGGSV